MAAVVGIILIILAIVAFFKVTAFALRVGLGIVAVIGILLIVVPLMIVNS